jgi:TPR repeat protein
LKLYSPKYKFYQNKSFAFYKLVVWGVFLFQFQTFGYNPLKETLVTIQQKAFDGDAYFQGVLALFHKHGERGMTIDLEEATRWAKMSAEKKGSLGLATLAALELEKGNIAKGRFLYDEAYLNTNLRKLGDKKDPLASFCLGMMEIDNPPSNIPKALRHLEDAATGGFPTAQATLGMVYFTGIGTAKNSALALKWCSKASQAKIPLGMFYLGMAYSVGDGIAMNDEIAMRWIHAAASRELAMGQLVLGMKLAQGDGISKNLPLAIQWLRRASQKGSADAALQLRRYENLLARSKSPPASYQVPNQQSSFRQNISKSISEDLSDRNKTNAFPDNSRNLAKMDEEVYQEEELIDPTLFDEPTDEGSSFLTLGLDNYKGSKFIDAKFYFDKAAAFNNTEAHRYLGILYFLGQGVSIDYKKATANFEKATLNGDLESKRYLRILKQFKE